MTEEQIHATTTVNAPAEIVFGLLADPTTHSAIDGTGWVRESRDGRPLTETGQIFRMAMYHENHPDGGYEVANKVTVFDPPRAIAWQPGSGPGHATSAGDDDAELEYGGWFWRYDLAPVGGRTEVTLTYDWSAVPPQVREYIEFPPFERRHLDNSLTHLGELVQARG